MLPAYDLEHGHDQVFHATAEAGDEVLALIFPERVFEQPVAVGALERHGRGVKGIERTTLEA